MRSALPLIVALGCATGGLAQAQQMTSPGLGSCDGQLSGTVGLAFPDSNGDLVSVQAAAIPTVFGQAECLCDSNDLQLEIFLTGALPSGTIATVEVWVGAGCDSYSLRTQPGQTACEKIATPDVNLFNLGGTSSGSRIYIPVPAASVVSPVVHDCTIPSASNAVWLFIYNNPQMPIASCTLQLNERTQGPAAPTNVSASSGDSAISINWEPPPSTMSQPSFFQILCADANDQPIPDSSADAKYSSCLPGGVLRRRALPTGGTLPTDTGTDGGTTTTLDLGSASQPLGPANLDEDPLDGGLPLDPEPRSLGTQSHTADGGTPLGPTTTALPAPFTNLDPAYICSPAINVSGRNYTTRIEGLENGLDYKFVVLSIDTNGNATPSALVIASPQPVEDLYRRYYSDDSQASGFCFVATAAFGSYEHRYVRVLRAFRDRVLLPTAPGRAFVSWYYANSPGPAAYIAEHRAARILAQLALWPLIGAAAAWLYLPPLTKVLLAAAAVAWLLYRRRRAARPIEAA